MFRWQQTMLKERIDQFVGIVVGRVVGAVGHGDSVLVAEEAIDFDRVVECFPASRRIFGTARYQKAPEM